MIEKELEKTYLAKSLPEELKKCKSKEIIDIYIPKEAEHPTLRIRKSGNRLEITKKEPVAQDASEQDEHTISLRESEFNTLSRLEGKRARKIRYYYTFKGKEAEIDVFKDGLEGLVLVDFEFETEQEKNNFEKPEFCLKDVTNELFIAGGMLCGKAYKDIEEKLSSLGYKRLAIK